MATEEVTIDEKGRILISKQIRERIGLPVGSKARVKVENEKIIIMPPVKPRDFIKEMEGCIKEGIPTVEPLDLKKIWIPKISGSK